jgi:hypothetical protein
MAKMNRRVIGSVVKAKDAGKPDYIKVRDDVVLKKGQVLRLESAKFQLDSLLGAVQAGKVSEDLGEKIKERIEKIPAFVRFEIVMLEERKD